MEANVLIVTQEPGEYSMLKEMLEQRLCAVTVCAAESSWSELSRYKPDVIVCDAPLFFSIQESIRAQRSRPRVRVPMLVVHPARCEEEMLLALDSGAADCIVKPFSVREAAARVKALLRRRQMAQAQQQVQIGEWTLYPSQYEIDLRTHRVRLLKREQEVLLLLADRKVVSREELVRLIWGYDYYGDSRVVDVNVSHLRRKIERNPRKPQYIQTIKGYGYRLYEPSDG